MELGILVRSTNCFQFGVSLFQGLLDLVVKTDITPTIFYHENGAVPFKPEFTMLQSSQIWGFTGNMISVDYDTTRFMAECPTIKKKFFYVWNIEWTHDIQSYNSNHIAYHNDEIELISRSTSHNGILTNTWKKPYAIMKDFNYETLEQIAKAS